MGQPVKRIISAANTILILYTFFIRYSFDLSENIKKLGYLAASITAAVTPALITAVTGIPISVKLFQNLELHSYFADKSDCF
ncbi:hypothetical protein FACS189442_3500 [Spirochaetia bacterium]|nr:hypothetical protein FACS189442_3500 [Spirochaetia bacterium]